jgi:hypothetical protein
MWGSGVEILRDHLDWCGNHGVKGVYQRINIPTPCAINARICTAIFSDSR